MKIKKQEEVSPSKCPNCGAGLHSSTRIETCQACEYKILHHEVKEDLEEINIEAEEYEKINGAIVLIDCEDFIKSFFYSK